MTTPQEILGKWKHYKGGVYIVENIAEDHTNGSTGRKMVLYRRDDETELYVRDIDDFFSRLEDGTPRYSKLTA